jgi:hypothetical protein
MRFRWRETGYIEVVSFLLRITPGRVRETKTRYTDMDLLRVSQTA